MTTIAYRDGVLAADSLATDDSGSIQVHKALILPNGDVAGGCGDLNEVTQALHWLSKGRRGRAPAMTNACILYTVNGVAHLAGGGWPGVQVKGFAAIGSGAQGAMVAMKLGLSAADAVAAVSGVDHCTGGEIEVLTYAKPKRGKRK